MHHINMMLISNQVKYKTKNWVKADLDVNILTDGDKNLEYKTQFFNKNVTLNKKINHSITCVIEIDGR